MALLSWMFIKIQWNDSPFKALGVCSAHISSLASKGPDSRNEVHR